MTLTKSLKLCKDGKYRQSQDDLDHHQITER